MDNPSYGDLPARLEDNRNKWHSLGITDYSMTTEYVCHCPEFEKGPYLSKISSREIQSVLDGSGAALSRAEVFNHPTVEELFGRIEDAMSSGYAKVEAEFDPQAGFPTNIGFDGDEDIYGDESRILVKKLEVTP